jgi:peptidoglycan/LPS O-acetylase OafA/YrhL
LRLAGSKTVVDLQRLRQIKVKTRFLNRIESVRGLAALCVAVTHTIGYLAVNPGLGRSLLDQRTPRDIALKIVNGFLNGETAVIVFFVISGLVIGRSLDSRRGGGAIGSDFVPFMIRRVLRLYPAHVVTILGIIGLAFIFLVRRAPVDFSAFPGSYPSMSADAAAWLNGKVFNPLKWQPVVANVAMASWTMNFVVWSLYAEICAAPFLPIFHRLARKGAGWLDAAVLAALIALTVLDWRHLWSRYLFAFYLGMIVETHGLAWAGVLERRLGGSRLAAAFVYVLMMLPNIFAAHRSAGVILVEAAGAFSIVALIVGSEGREPFKVLDHSLIRWNGRLSYSFYLWHFFVMTIAVRTLYVGLSATDMSRFEVPIILATAAATIAIALGIAQLSYRWVERPSVDLGRYLAGRWERFAKDRRSAKSAAEVWTA